MLVFFNGKFINEQNAKVSINNRSFRYGDGFFETIKCINGHLPLWEYHSQRLFSTLSAFQFTPPKYFNDAFIRNAIDELVSKNLLKEYVRVRITIFRGDGGIYDAINHQPNILIQTWPLNPENNNLNENGLVTGDFTTGFKAADTFANLKSNNYLLYAMAALHAKRQHLNDVFVFNHNRRYCDATIANLWVVKNGEVFTPSLAEGPVAGVMRRYLIENLPALGIKVTEGELTPDDIKEADEVFITNAIYGLKWVKQHNDTSFSNKLTARIHAALMAPLWAATI
jgi:aminodeoxychorismate lyase